MKQEDILGALSGVRAIDEVVNSSVNTIQMEGVSGSLFGVIVAFRALQQKGVHLVVAEDRDAASYIYNDIYNIIGAKGAAENKVLFMPTAYKRAINSKREDPSGIAQRTAVLGAITQYNNSDHPLIICTYPEAIVEKVVSRKKLEESILILKVGEKLDIKFLEELLISCGFNRTDFVSEPGHYAVRGGIVDLFSFSNNYPYRVEMFGNEIESLRTFAIATQLSVENINEAKIIPNLKGDTVEVKRVSLIDFIDKIETIYVSSPRECLLKMDATRAMLIGELDEPTEIDNLVSSANQFRKESAKHRMITFYGKLQGRDPEAVMDLNSQPQPAFNKNFELLATTIKADSNNAITTYILSENIAQIERLENIFAQISGSIDYNVGRITLHRGFMIETLRLYTDHQLFDRFHKYKIHNEIDKSQSLTIAELNMLKIGDYVVHIDHGVGKFGGLVRATEAGVVKESIKLTYRDGDVLMVAVHNLHRISRYKAGDTETPPTIHKLGGSTWSKLKATTKRKVKEMARELIALYAKRKACVGFAYSPDSYLQQELEASFMYEDTPDQLAVTNAVKIDMEKDEPMDRLVCGDVGFGKTEIAIRAAFKAATDGKQVAILVPTTVLSLQHYRTFARRLKEFPVRVENLSRVKSTKQTNEILADLADGKIDIIIGTHKLLGKTVQFKDLGLLIIDEEQKFGVANKEKLRMLRTSVDVLTLTATPIPRTLQFSLLGVRDMSLISTPPPNRQPVTTELHSYSDEILKDAIEYEVQRGGQVFVLHNRVQSIEQMAMKIRGLCPSVKVAVGHGQMPATQLEKVMMEFIYGEFDVFVATTIIESGIDIPNANTIVINNANMFGLSDLHQLRGRVGRTNRKAFCYMLVPSESVLTPDASRRLRAIEEFSDLGSGFNIAMQDLDIRGAGNILGGEQSGFIADIGYETYQKIINEAVMELKQEEGMEAIGGLELDIDCHIESDWAAYLPDEYIGSTAEKIRLYRKFDSFSSEDEIDVMVAQMEDRFGALPVEAKELVSVVKLRHEAARMAIERIVVRRGVATLYFLSDQNHSYYKSSEFSRLLRGVVTDFRRYTMGQKAATGARSGKVTLVVRNVESCEELRSLLAGLQR